MVARPSLVEIPTWYLRIPLAAVVVAVVVTVAFVLKWRFWSWMRLAIARDESRSVPVDRAACPTLHRSN